MRFNAPTSHRAAAGRPASMTAGSRSSGSVVSSGIAAATIALALSIGAAAAAVPAVSGAAVVDSGVWTALASVHELRAEFVQVQHRAILRQPLSSTGTVRFTRPATLTWEVLTPARSTFSLDRGVARMQYPDLQMDETVDLAAVPDAQRLASSLLVWLQADVVAVERDFTTTYLTNPPGAHLTPRDPKLAALLAGIDLRFASSPWRVAAVTLEEPGGDRVECLFRHVVLDGLAVPDPA